MPEGDTQLLGVLVHNHNIWFPLTDGKGHFHGEEQEGENVSLT